MVGRGENTAVFTELEEPFPCLYLTLWLGLLKLMLEKNDYQHFICIRMLSMMIVKTKIKTEISTGG